jgi:hypothetical protein
LNREYYWEALLDFVSKTERAEEFFEDFAESNPEEWSELESRYPVNSKYDELRFRIGEPPKRRRNRMGKSGGVPKDAKRRFTQDEWREHRKAKDKYLQEWYEEYRYAKKLADEGM